MAQPDLTRLFETVCGETRTRLTEIKDTDWAKPTPCEEWDVRALLNHITNELLWTGELLAGKTIAEVGDKFDGDVLGDDPKQAWEDAANGAIAAVKQPDALATTTHLSYGDIPGREYIEQMLVDQTIHTWDLAKAIGVDTAMDEELVEVVYKLYEPTAEMGRKAGIFGPAVDTTNDADTLTKLITLSGRQP